MLLSQQKFQKVMSYQADAARQMFEQQATELAPVLILIVDAPGKTETHVLLIADGFEGSSKYLIMQAIGAEYGEKKAIVAAAFLICEAWVSVLPAGEKTSVLPADDPNRKEAVIVSGLTANQEFGSATAEISQQADGQRRLGEFKSFTGEAPNRLLVEFYKSYAESYLAPFLN